MIKSIIIECVITYGLVRLARLAKARIDALDKDRFDKEFLLIGSYVPYIFAGMTSIAALYHFLTLIGL